VEKEGFLAVFDWFRVPLFEDAGGARVAGFAGGQVSKFLDGVCVGWVRVGEGIAYISRSMLLCCILLTVEAVNVPLFRKLLFRSGTNFLRLGLSISSHGGPGD
jgi:hypothetical protein